MRVFEGMKDHVHLVVGGCWLGLTGHHAGLKSFGSGSTQSWSAKDKDSLCTGQELLVYPMKPQSVLASKEAAGVSNSPLALSFREVDVRSIPNMLNNCTPTGLCMQLVPIFSFLLGSVNFSYTLVKGRPLSSDCNSFPVPWSLPRVR